MLLFAVFVDLKFSHIASSVTGTNETPCMQTSMSVCFFPLLKPICLTFGFLLVLTQFVVQLNCEVLCAFEFKKSGA